MLHFRVIPRPLYAIAMLLMLLGAPLAAGRVAAREQGESTLRVQQQDYPESLDPQLSLDISINTVISANYEGLTRLDQDLNVVPAAAESWEINDDGAVLIFHLRESLTYSDGSPLTAERFADAVRRACDPNVPGDYQHILFDVVGCQEFATLLTGGDGGTPVPGDDLAAYEAAKASVGVQAIDERTLEIRLTHPAPYFLAIAGMPVFYPAKQELIAQGGENWSLDPVYQVGNGPFQVTRMEPELLVVFVANEHYWGGRPTLDRLEYVYVADSSVALEAYLTGDLDIASLDASLLPAVASDPRVSGQVVRVDGAATSLLAFNLSKAPFTDKKVREAFAYAFDRQTYCDLVRDGTCEPALSWIPPGIPGAIATDAYAFDPEKARRALADSAYGGPDQLPEITFAYWVEDPLAADRVEWIAGQYRDILGVTIEFQPLEGMALVAVASDLATFPQMTMDGWFQDYPDPQNWLSVFWTCRTGFAAAFGYCNPEFDTLVEQADRELDAAKRLTLYEAAGELLVADAPGVFVSHDIVPFLVKPEVTGYAPTPQDSGWPGQTASLLTVDITR
jgi:oligopeptide transport system substrate-binding protein